MAGKAFQICHNRWYENSNCHWAADGWLVGHWCPLEISRKITNDNYTHFHAPFAHALQLSLIMVLVVKIATCIVIKGFGFCCMYFRWHSLLALGLWVQALAKSNLSSCPSSDRHTSERKKKWGEADCMAVFFVVQFLPVPISIFCLVLAC